MSNVNSWLKDPSGNYDGQSQSYLQNANVQISNLDPSMTGYMNEDHGKVLFYFNFFNSIFFILASFFRLTLLANLALL